MISNDVKTVKGLVKELRSVRDKLNVDLEHMTPAQRTEYFRKMRERSHSPQQSLK